MQNKGPLGALCHWRLAPAYKTLRSPSQVKRREGGGETPGELGGFAAGNGNNPLPCLFLEGLPAPEFPQRIACFAH